MRRLPPATSTWTGRTPTTRKTPSTCRQSSLSNPSSRKRRAFRSCWARSRLRWSRVEGQRHMSSTTAVWPLISLRQILTPISRPMSVEPLKTYPLLGMHWYAQGLYIKEQKQGSQIQAGTLYQVKEGDFVYNRLFAWKGSFGIAGSDTADCYVSNEFPCFRVDETRAFPPFL